MFEHTRVWNPWWNTFDGQQNAMKFWDLMSVLQHIMEEHCFRKCAGWMTEYITIHWRVLGKYCHLYRKRTTLWTVISHKWTLLVTPVTYTWGFSHVRKWHLWRVGLPFHLLLLLSQLYLWGSPLLVRFLRMWLFFFLIQPQRQSHSFFMDGACWVCFSC